MINGIPERKTKIRGQFGKGVSCAIKYALSIYKDIDINLLKLNKTESAPTMVLGDAWGKKYTTEKRILDSIINAIKKSSYDFTGLNDWIQPQEELTRRFGLDYEGLISNPLLEESERTWIRQDFKVSTFVADEKKGSISSVADLQAFTKRIKDYQRSLKPVKDFIGDIVSQRVKLAYGHPLNKSIKRRQKGIEPLISNIKKTREYLVAFNIGRSARLPRPFVPPAFPTSDGELQLFVRELTAWETTYVGDVENSTRARQVANWFEGAINN